jgi:F0F1-type ATP synthase membrane subunit a
MDLVILIAAILVAIAVFTWLLRVVKATLNTALSIAVVVLITQLVFGIGPGELFAYLQQFWQAIWNSLFGPPPA